MMSGLRKQFNEIRKKEGRREGGREPGRERVRTSRAAGRKE